MTHGQTRVAVRLNGYAGPTPYSSRDYRKRGPGESPAPAGSESVSHLPYNGYSMTPDDFKAWRKAMGISQDGAAEVLQLSKATIQNYERGVRLDGKPAPIPHTTALACAALFHRIAPWGD